MVVHLLERIQKSQTGVHAIGIGRHDTGDGREIGRHALGHDSGQQVLGSENADQLAIIHNEHALANLSHDHGSFTDGGRALDNGALVIADDGAKRGHGVSEHLLHHHLHGRDLSLVALAAGCFAHGAGHCSGHRGAIDVLGIIAFLNLLQGGDGLVHALGDVQDADDAALLVQHGQVAEAVVHHHLQRIERRVFSRHALGIASHDVLGCRRGAVDELRDHSACYVVVGDDATEVALGAKQQCGIGALGSHHLGHLMQHHGLRTSDGLLGSQLGHLGELLLGLRSLGLGLAIRFGAC